MTDPETSKRTTGPSGWLRSTITLSLPGWAVAAGALALVLVILLALD
ncbi:MAG: hypothetical protein MUF63_06995 [Rhodobacteraceae bacterium]|jgi:hypothetical protein|nr:hypothetical protein [Paracoccaceae bacterium]